MSKSNIRYRTSLASALLLLSSMSFATAQDQGGQPFSQNVTITGKKEGPYNLRATVKAPDKPAILTDSQAKKKPKPDDLNYDAAAGFIEIERIMAGRKTPSELEKERYEQQMKAMKDQAEQLRKMTAEWEKMQTNKPGSVGPSTNSEDHHKLPTDSEDHHKLPTDGSPNADSITGSAINSFYEGLPQQVTNYLSGNSGINLGNDAYADYASALQSSDFARMRQLANSQDIADFNQRIAMLGLAGAAALNSLAKPQNSNNFAAKDTLRKVAEDLRYAGQGLDPSKPNEAKLKAICEDISRIWGNMTKPGK